MMGGGWFMGILVLNEKEKTLMNIPLNADVHCIDQACGRSTSIILNPVTQEITHVVVNTGGILGVEYLVPLELVAQSTPTTIHLRCSHLDFVLLPPFQQTQYIASVDRPDWLSEHYELNNMMMWPYARLGMEDEGMAVNIEQIPHNELAIHRGAHVEATDGRVGRVDEFLVNPTNNHITHLVLREGHLWGQKDVTIPISAIDRIEEDVVYLTLDQQTIKAMPAVPIHR